MNPHEEKPPEITPLWGTAALIIALLIVGVIAWGVITCLGWMYGALAPVNSTVATRQTYQDISSLSDSSLTNGRFFIGCGSMKEVPHYFFYLKKNNTYTLGWVPAEQTTIIEDDPPVPYFQTNEPIEITCYPDNKCYEDTYHFKRVTFELHVPTGTVRGSYNLDGV